MKFLLLLLAISLNVLGSEKPNLVFIMADDCTFRDLEVYGGQAKTPNLNKLATQGMKFSRCFQAAPMCSPTRHNVFTGLYPVKSGAWPNHTRAYSNVKSIAHHLSSAGYETYFTGKRHIGPSTVFPFKYLGQGKPIEFNMIDEVIKKSVEETKPFCMIVCSNEPHAPWTKGDASVYPPESVKLPPYIVDTAETRVNFSKYLAEVTYFDKEVGKIIDIIDRNGLKDNTLIMVVSEQGNAFPFAKWTCYDSGLQSCMIVRWPAKVAAGSVSDAMVEYVDVTPTLVDAAGGKLISQVDGLSFLNILTGKVNRHKDYVYGIMTTRGINNGPEAYAIRSVRSDKYKLIINFNYENKFTNACTKSTYFLSMVEKANNGDTTAKRLVKAYQYRPHLEFYDIQKDPFEMNNLSGDPEYSDIVKSLKSKLDMWMKSQGDEGIKTEMAAETRQNRAIKKRSKK